MRWGAFLITTVIIASIILFEWPKVKQKPKKDKSVFIVLLFIGWILSAFDLPHTPGPVTGLETLFEPLRSFIEAK